MQRLSSLFSRGIPLLEAVLALLFLAPATVRFASAAAILYLLIATLLLLARNRRSGDWSGCHCFGADDRLDSANQRSFFTRNLILVLACAGTWATLTYVEFASPRLALLAPLLSFGAVICGALFLLRLVRVSATTQ